MVNVVVSVIDEVGSLNLIVPVGPLSYSSQHQTCFVNAYQIQARNWLKNFKMLMGKCRFGKGISSFDSTTRVADGLHKVVLLGISQQQMKDVSTN